MKDAAGGPSLRKHTSTIRHLDAARARELVDLFRRPAEADEGGLVAAADDPVAAAAHGWLALDPACDSTAVLGHYKTHLYLHELLRLPLSVARELARHRGHLYLDKLTGITDAAALAIARHRGGGLSLNNLRALSPTAARALGKHEGELSLNRLTHLDDEAAEGLGRHRNDLYLWGV
jgi:hypothetical protein